MPTPLKHEIQLVTIRELEDLIRSDAFQRWQTIPISPWRVHSQVRNPRANPADVALIIAKDEQGEVIAFIGFLPDQNREQQTVTWNSCWWAHPEKGGSAGIQIFYKGLQLWGDQLAFDDLPDHSVKILQKMEDRFVLENMEGVRGIVRFYLETLFANAFPASRLWRWKGRQMDRFLNMLLAPKWLFWKRKFLHKELSIDYIPAIDTEASGFLEKHLQREYFQRGRAELNWILRYPWIVPTSEDTGNIQNRYPFTAVSDNFKQGVAKIKQDGILIGVLIYNCRNGLCKLPYVYFDPAQKEEILLAVYRLLLDIRATNLICFHPDLAPQMLYRRSVFFWARSSVKTRGYSNALENSMSGNPLWQDGDGDWSFT